MPFESALKRTRIIVHMMNCCW